MNEFDLNKNEFGTGAQPDTQPEVQYSDPYARPQADVQPVQADTQPVQIDPQPMQATVQQPVQPSFSQPVPTMIPDQPMQREQPVQTAQSPYVQQSYAPADFTPKPKKKSGKRWALSVAAICASLIIAGGSFYAGVTYNASTAGTQTTTATTSKNPVSATNTVSASGDGTEVSSTITEVVEQAMPSMVAINTITEQSMTGYGANPFFYYMFGDEYDQTYETSASGSGIIIAQSDDELLIATNNHVIEDANSISVQFIDDQSYDATIKGTAAENDLAVIAVKLSDISADTLSKIKVATLGSSEDLKLGEPAIAIGNSLGYGQSVTVGYISAVDREVQISDRTMSLIQTDAAINPGNSGGALLNIKGEVIGINSAKYSDTSVEGTGYAIPISVAEPIINELMNSNSITNEEKPFLGIYGQDVPASYQERFGWPEGVYVSQVTSGSPAQLAGITAGDIITAINGKNTSTMDELQTVLEECKVGDKITIDITRVGRNGQTTDMTLTATLISRDDAGVDE